MRLFYECCILFFLSVILFAISYIYSPHSTRNSSYETMLDYHVYGMWAADGQQWFDKGYKVEKDRPLTSSNVDIDSIFNFNNQPREAMKNCFACDENLMRKLICDNPAYRCKNNSFVVKSSLTENSLVIRDRKVLSKRYMYPPLNLLFQWVFIPVNTNYCDCIVYIANYEAGLNNVVMNHLTAYEDTRVEATPFIGMKEQHWVIEYLEESPNRIYFYIKSWYWGVYLSTNEEGEVYLSKYRTVNGKWFIEK